MNLRRGVCGSVFNGISKESERPGILLAKRRDKNTEQRIHPGIFDPAQLHRALLLWPARRFAEYQRGQRIGRVLAPCGNVEVLSGALFRGEGGFGLHAACSFTSTIVGSKLTRSAIALRCSLARCP